jgi:hypothetical protein
MTGPRRQLTVEEHVLLVCPHCWTAEQISREYPELTKYPVSDRVCDFHLEVLLRRTVELPAARKEDLAATGRKQGAAEQAGWKGLSAVSPKEV